MKKAAENNEFCSLDYFMKHGCQGCKLGRKCDEYYDRIKRIRNNNNRNSNISTGDKKHSKEVI